MTDISEVRLNKRAKTRRVNHIFSQLAEVFKKEGINPSLKKRKRGTRKLLTTTEAAKLLGRKKHTLENWRSIGTGPAFHKVGGSIVYKHADIADYLQARKFKSTSAYFALPENREVAL